MGCIWGIYRHNRAVNPDELTDMGRTMPTLGPDGFRLWQSTNIGLGHGAFHLTEDSCTEVLPHYDTQKTIAIVSDTRLDNRKELCREFNLVDSSHVSDSQLILLAYQKWGKDCPKFLLGEFAVVLWDKPTNDMLFFVDHTGQRSFYYYQDHSLFAFATQINALHALPDIRRLPNLTLIAHSEDINYILTHSEQTCYQNIFKVQSRTLYHLKNNQLHNQPYWTPNPDHRLQFRDEEEYIDAFQDLLSTVITSKLRSHFPVTTLLSGGLDSSSITGMAATILEKTGQSLTAFSAVLPQNYQGNGIDESEYIQLLQRDNLVHTPVTDTFRGPFDDFLKGDLDEIGKTSRFYLYTAFASAARRHNSRIILDGCYGEMGPSYYAKGYYAELLATLKWTTFLTETRRYTQQRHSSWLKMMIKEGIIPFLPPSIQDRIHTRSDIHLMKKTSFITQEFVQKYRSHFKPALSINTQHSNHYHHHYQHITRLHSQSPFIHSDDGSPICFSCPFQDKRLLEFCYALPGNLKVRNGYQRYALRSGMKNILPDALRFRTTKTPFSPDYHDRYNRQLPAIREVFSNIPRTSLMTEIIDFQKLDHALQTQMKTNKCSTSIDFSAMHTIPHSLNLMIFLASFRE